MKNLRPDVILFDCTGRSFAYEQYCKIKLVIQYQFLLWNVETTICDDDVVFLKNPLELFASNSHIEVASECGATEFSASFDFANVNVGFFRVIPSSLSLRLYNKWLHKAIPNSIEIDQNVLAQLIASLRREESNTGVQRYDVKSLLGSREDLVVRWYDPLDVVNGLVFHQQGIETSFIARTRGIKKPYLVHLSWIPQEQKISVFSLHELWFVDSGKCGKTPAGTKMEDWEK
jgi:hypothetical protein